MLIYIESMHDYQTSVSLRVP